jgi:hypothetical protein
MYFRGHRLLLIYRDILIKLDCIIDRLCDLVVRIPDYRSRSPGFDSRPYQIF